MHARYIEGTEERKNADKEYYRVKNELLDGILAKHKEESETWLQDQDDYDLSTPTSKLAAYRRMLYDVTDYNGDIATEMRENGATQEEITKALAKRH